MHRKRRGISPVVSTVIIFSALIMILVGVLAYANSLFQMQADQAEFSQAQDSTYNLAEVVESVSLKPGAEDYVRYNPRTGGPNFVSNVGTISLSVNGTLTPTSANNIIMKGVVNAFVYRGGPMVGVVNQIIRPPPVGNSGLQPAPLIIYGNVEPLGFVNLTQRKGANIFMDFNRVEIIRTGMANYSSGMVIVNGVSVVKWVPVEVFQVSFINISYYGQAYGAGSGGVSVIASNSQITQTVYSITDPYSNSTRSYRIQFKCTLGGQSATYNSTSIVKPQNILNYNTVVIVNVANVKLNFLGG